MGLSKLTTDTTEDNDKAEVCAMTTHSLNIGGYLDDLEVDNYHLGTGKKVNF